MVAIRLNCLEADVAKKDAEQSESKTQIQTTLYVRQGLLISFVPENPTPELAEALLNDFKSNLQKWQASYRESISLAAKVNASKLKSVNDYLRLGWQKAGASLVLEYPRLRIPDGERSFETRTCIAICATGKSSSKIWSRVSLPVDMPDTSSRLQMDKVPDLCPRFQDIVDVSVRWAFDKLQEILPSHLPESRLETKTIIKVAILGITDSDLAAPFARLCEEGITAEDVLQDAKLDEKLTSYCQKVSDFSGMLSSYVKQKDLNKTLWFKIPLCVVLDGGETAERIVLFFMRDVKGYSEIIGLSYDDSEKGDIALRVGRKLSDVIGPWI